MFFTRLYLSYHTTWKRSRATKEVGFILLHLSTGGLSVYTIQVTTQWKSYCKEWTTV